MFPSDGEWCEDLQCESGVVVTSTLDKVYLCLNPAPDFSVSCYTFQWQTKSWSKLFTTEENTDKILMLSLSGDER